MTRWRPPKNVPTRSENYSQTPASGLPGKTTWWRPGWLVPGARGEARVDSDVDLVLLTVAKQSYLEDETWVWELGGLRVIRTEQWGPTMTERRFVLPSGLEVEAGIAPPSWAATDPVDPNLRAVILDGFRILYDPEGLLARLVEACR